MQLEGKKVKKALALLGTIAKSVEVHQSKIGKPKKDFILLKATK